MEQSTDKDYKKTSESLFEIMKRISASNVFVRLYRFGQSQETRDKENEDFLGLAQNLQTQIEGIQKKFINDAYKDIQCTQDTNNYITEYKKTKWAEYGEQTIAIQAERFINNEIDYQGYLNATKNVKNSFGRGDGRNKLEADLSRMQTLRSSAQVALLANQDYIEANQKLANIKAEFIRLIDEYQPGWIARATGLAKDKREIMGLLKEYLQATDDKTRANTWESIESKMQTYQSGLFFAEGHSVVKSMVHKVGIYKDTFMKVKSESMAVVTESASTANSEKNQRLLADLKKYIEDHASSKNEEHKQKVAVATSLVSYLSGESNYLQVAHVMHSNSEWNNGRLKNLVIELEHGTRLKEISIVHDELLAIKASLKEHETNPLVKTVIQGVDKMLYGGAGLTRQEHASINSALTTLSLAKVSTKKGDGISLEGADTIKKNIKEANFLYQKESTIPEFKLEKPSEPALVYRIPKTT